MIYKKIIFVAIFSFIVILGCKRDKPFPDISSGLVAFFPLNGMAIDSINNVYGINHKATSIKNRAEIEGKAMNFYRVDTAFINFGDHLNYSLISNQFTINCWVCPVDSFYSCSIFSKRNPWGPFEYSMDNHFSHSVFNFDNWPSDGNGTVYGIDPLSASSYLKLNEWHMISFIADGSTLRVYSDGILEEGIDDRNMSRSFNDTDAPLMIGVGGGFGVNYYFNGGIDDVRIYNRVLTEEQIKYLLEK